MSARLSIAITLSLLATVAHAGEGLIPLTPDQGLAAEGTTILRGATTLTLYQRPDAEPLRLTIDARRIGRYEDAVVASWPADVEVARRSVSVAPGETGELLLPDCAPGPVEVLLNTGLNAATVACNGPLVLPVAADGPDGPAHFISSVGRLHFFVPAGARRFTASVRGQGTEENARLTVFAPDGREAGSATSIGSQGAELRVDVPAEDAGAAWSLTAGKPDTGTFEDCFISFGREVPQYLSSRPDGLLVPFVSGLRRPASYVGPGEEPTVRFALTRPVERGTLSARCLTDQDELSEPVSADASEGAIEVPITGAVTALQVTLESPDLPALSATTPVALLGTMLFVGGYEPLIGVEPAGAATEETGVRLSLALAEAPPGLRVEAALRRSEPSHAPGSAAAEVVQLERIDGWDGAPVELMPDDAPGNGAYEWQIVLRDESGTLLDWTRSGFLLWDGIYFVDHTPGTSGALERAIDAPWVSYATEGADAIPYRHRPSRDGIDGRVRLMATPGEYESATVGVLALADTAGLRATLSELRAASGASIPANAWEVRWARYWPQRTGWTAKAYQVVPEMLERRASVDLAAFEPAQAWLTLHVPDGAEPGRYQGTVTLEDARGKSQAHRVIVSVEPFALMEPAEYHWGLYSDSGRWKSMPEAQVRAEMRDFVAHGITSAMMYPPVHSEFSMEGDGVRVDSSEFERYMRWALQEGLRPPTVISMQALGGRVKQLVPDAEVGGEQFERVYKQIVQHFVDVGEREGWGELVWHAVDEPNRKHADRIQAAYERLSWFKDLGQLTFTTVNDPVVAQENLDPVLDARCYYAYFVGRSAEEQAARAAETADSGDRLWLYGTGCYIGMDGTTMPNRFLAGYMLRKTQAEGIWCWTLQRAKGDIYNDFDAEGMSEAKEACTTYVSEDGTEMMPTLQWEGHREGVDDFRYVYTLERLAADRGERGREALAKFDALLGDVPWGLRPIGFTAADSDALRSEIAGLIRELLEE